MTKPLRPAIKWAGSKRSQALEIISTFSKFNTYYEPFIGGGAILGSLNPSNAICGDICKPLIDFWTLLKSSPDELANSYELRWNNLRKTGHTYYYDVRARFNKNQNPEDLLFLSRTCVNGLIRFNKKGEFNNSLHHTRRGINPKTLKDILNEWSARIQGSVFIFDDYRKTTKQAKEGDLVYLDPPYFHTKGRYYGNISFDDFVEYLYTLNNRGVSYAISFDGYRGATHYKIEIPDDLYETKYEFVSGNSPFKKVMDKSTEPVTETLYTSWVNNQVELTE